MTIDALSEYLKIIARDTVNKMEKKKKIIKSIICILTALIIAGCFIAMAFMPKIFEKKSASAENQNVDNPPTQVDDKFTITGLNNSSYNASQQIIYAQNTENSNESNITLQFKKNLKVILTRYKEITIGYTAYCNTESNVMYVEYGYFDGEKEIKIAQSWLPYTTEYNVYKTQTTDLQYTAQGSRVINYIKIQYQKQNTTDSWIQIYKLSFTQNDGTTDISKAPYYKSYLENIIQGAHDKGYNNGYQIGHNAGYQEGYDKGIVSEWKSPIAIFIQPIDSFLSTNIFGSISIGDVLSVILFVMVGIIFIKMFAGG